MKHANNTCERETNSIERNTIDTAFAAAQYEAAPTQTTRDGVRTTTTTHLLLGRWCIAYELSVGPRAVAGVPHSDGVVGVQSDAR
jgi:hypothetical protein